jgi:hypothetical protein
MVDGFGRIRVKLMRKERKEENKEKKIIRFLGIEQGYIER